MPVRADEAAERTAEEEGREEQDCKMDAICSTQCTRDQGDQRLVC